MSVICTSCKGWYKESVRAHVGLKFPIYHLAFSGLRRPGVIVFTRVSERFIGLDLEKPSLSEYICAVYRTAIGSSKIPI